MRVSRLALKKSFQNKGKDIIVRTNHDTKVLIIMTRCKASLFLPLECSWIKTWLDVTTSDLVMAVVLMFLLDDPPC